MPRPIRRHGPNTLRHSAAPARLPVAELEITRGRARNQIRKIEGLAYLIGAAEDNDLVLGDPQFPESHCYLLRSPLGLTLCWMGEGPEITIDGNPVLSSALVRDGARLRTGPYEFRIRLSWPVDESSAEFERNRVKHGDEAPAVQASPCAVGPRLHRPVNSFAPQGNERLCR